MNYEELKQRLLPLDTACVCDANKGAAKELRVIDSGIRPIRTGLKLVGRAHTVSCYEDFLTVIKGLRDAAPGEVLVIDSRGSRRALAGELFPTEARRKGLAGIVIDGPCRDTAAIRALDLPYYARSVCCYAGTTNRLFETQVPINCGGVVVNPGDVLFGDDDGIIVGNVEEFAAIIETAEAIQQAEQALLGRMAAGTGLMEMLNFEDHCAEIAAGRASKLQFVVD
jgi:RraA family protein